jgi:hypothetical protein
MKAGLSTNLVRWLAPLALALALSLLGACSSLPHIHPDMARSSGAPQLEGARGPLSARERRR